MLTLRRTQGQKVPLKRSYKPIRKTPHYSLGLRSSPIAKRIVELISEAGIQWPGGAKNAAIKRTGMGYWGRRAGQWSWILWALDRPFHLVPSIGSKFHAKELVRYGLTVHKDRFNHHHLYAKIDYSHVARISGGKQRENRGLGRPVFPPSNPRFMGRLCCREIRYALR